jgi:hypothetical protein
VADAIETLSPTRNELVIMHMPFRRSKPLPVRLLHAAAAGAGSLRMALSQRTLQPQRKDSGRLKQALRRS